MCSKDIAIPVYFKNFNLAHISYKTFTSGFIYNMYMNSFWYQNTVCLNLVVILLAVIVYSF